MEESEYSRCLFEIFRQIKVKCETEKPNCSNNEKYEDLIQFVVSFVWIRDELFNWDAELYELIGLYDIDYDQTIDFDVIYNGLQSFTKKERDIFFKFYIKSINEDTELNELKLKYTSGACNEDHMVFFDMIIKALQNNRSLNYLAIEMKGGFTLNKLSNVCHLKSLTLHVKINSQELAEFCRLNTKLGQLFIINDDIDGRLADIVLDGNNLQNLTHLNFVMKPNIDAAEYAPLAKLRTLKYLYIDGKHKIGSLRHLFNGFAAKTSYRNLRYLTIRHASLNDEECQALSQMKSLKYLECGFIEAKSIGHLSQLCELSDFKITSKNNVSKMLPELIKIVKSTKNGINIRFPLVKLEYTKANDELTWTPDTHHFNASEYVVLCQFPNLRIIVKERTTANIFFGFSLEMPQILEHLQFLSTSLFHIHGGLTYEEISEIAAIKSLKSIDCNVSDLSNIRLLGQLPQLEELTIKLNRRLTMRDTDALKELFTVLVSKRDSTLKSFKLLNSLIDLNLANELFQIKSLKSLKCWFIDDESIKSLNNNTQLDNLAIKIGNISDWILRNAPQMIFQTLSSHKNVEIVDNRGNSITYNPSSTEAKLQLTLKKKTDGTPFALLGCLENVHSFRIFGEYKLGSLQLLFRSLSRRENDNLKVFQIENYTINYEETVLVSKIKSIRKLICTFSDPRSFNIVHPNTNFKEIRLNATIFPNEILGFLNKSEGKVIIKNDARQITYYKSEGKLILEKFTWNSFDASEFAFLGKIDNLQIVHINGDHKDGSIKNILTELVSRPRLKELMIKRSIGSDDMSEIAKMTSLRILKCGFFRSPPFETLAQLKELQHLTITYHYGSLDRLFQGLSSQISPVLQFLSIRCGITLDELKAISSIKSLKRLECIITDTENMDALPTLPQLTELCINNYRNGTLLNILKLFSNSGLENITITGDPLDAQDVAALAQCKFLKKLVINLRELESVDLLFSLEELKELHVNLIEDENSTEVSLNLRKYPQNLRKVVIRNRSIGIKDITNVLQLPGLKSLDFILDIDKNDVLGELGQLEELIITPKRGSLKRTLQALAEKPNPILKHFVINNVFLDPEESSLLSQLNSLTTLECKFKNDKSLHYLTQLTNIEKLKITEIANCKDVPKQLLNIIRDCIKLETINLNNNNIFKEIGWNFLKKALDLVKTYRNPMLQKPLNFVVPGFPETYEINLTRSDKRYLTIYSEDD